MTEKDYSTTTKERANQCKKTEVQKVWLVEFIHKCIINKINDRTVRQDQNKTTPCTPSSENSKKNEL